MTMEVMIVNNTSEINRRDAEGTEKSRKKELNILVLLFVTFRAIAVIPIMSHEVD
jgi:hypothetical protein